MILNSFGSKDYFPIQSINQGTMLQRTGHMLEIKDTPVFTYLVYQRDLNTDVDTLKKEIGNILFNLAPDKDVVLDMSNIKNISSSEIGIIVKVRNQCNGRNRIIRVVANPMLKKMLDSTGMSKLSDLLIYETREQFAEELKKLIPPIKKRTMGAASACLFNRFSLRWPSQKP
jgi:anti-anti-sigma factor